MLERFPQDDKYFKCHAMFGYTLRDYVRDTDDELIDLHFPYIAVFLGSLQLGRFEATKIYKDVNDLMKSIAQQNNRAQVLITGLVLRPTDYPKSRKYCENYNSSYRLIAQKVKHKEGLNIAFKDPFLEFLGLDGSIIEPQVNFVDEIFLSALGARKL